MITAKGERTRLRILDAAADSLIVGGVENLNVDDVLARTKSSKSQLFLYFPGGKRQLRMEATKRQIERLFSSGESPDLSSWQGWESWVEASVRMHEAQLADDACEVAALAGRALETDVTERAIVGQALDGWFELLRKGLKSMQELELIRADAPIDDLAALLLSAVSGGTVLDKATRSKRYLDAALRSAFDHVRSFGVTETDRSVPKQASQ